MQRLEGYIEKHKEGLITAIKNDTDNTMANRMTINRKQEWEEKQLCGRFKRLISNISYEKTWTWLRKGNFKRETESLLIAAQNNAIRTNHIKARIDKTQQNRKCRLCGDRDEIINHIISECSKIAQKEYKTRHNWMDKGIHWEMCKEIEIWPYEQMVYIQPNSCPGEWHTNKILGDFNIQTDHLISPRRPHLIIINRKKKEKKKKRKKEENLQNCRLYYPGWPQNKTERMWKEG